MAPTIRIFSPDDNLIANNPQDVIASVSEANLVSKTKIPGLPRAKALAMTPLRIFETEKQVKKCRFLTKFWDEPPEGTTSRRSDTHSGAVTRAETKTKGGEEKCLTLFYQVFTLSVRR